VAVKRNNRITSVVGGIDSRLRSLEATGTLAISSSLSDLVSTDSDSDSTPRENFVLIPPDTYKKIIGARIYGPAATGNFGTRVELYFEENIVPDPDPNVAVDELGVIISEDEDGKQTLQQIQVYGVNGYSGTSIALSSGKLFNPIEVAYDEPSWAENGLRGNEVLDQTEWRQTPPVSATTRDVVANTRVAVNSTIWYNPIVQDPDKTDKNGKDLIVTRAVDSATVTGTNVVVTLNAASHLFKVGDVISVDIPAPFIGLDYYDNDEPDGLFEITGITSNTISYSLDVPVSSTQTYTYNGTTRHYVYAVARPYVPEETIWIDKRTEPNTVWVWKKYRWYNTAEGVGDVAAEKDGIAPSPVTSLAGTSTLPAGTTTPVINLTWTPPTTRSNGASLSGFLDGYDIWYKRTTEAVWKTQFVKDGAGAVSSAQINDAIILQNFNYNIRVYAVDIMGQYSTVATVNVLTAKYSETLNPPSKPTVSSRLGTITVSWDGNDSTGNLPVRGVLYVEVHRSTTSGFTPSSSTLISTIQNNLGGDYVVVSDLAYGTNYYFKLVFVRQISPTELEDSNPSTQSDAIQVSPLVDTDVIANTISGAKITPGTLIASEKIVANSITSAEINALAITAGKIAANAIEADKIAAGAITASIIDSKQIDLKANAIATQRITLTSTGITAFNTANDVTFSLNGTTGTINAASINVQNINANNISAGIIQGIEIRTADTANTRTVLNQNDIKFFIGGVATEVATVRGFLSNVYDYETNSYVSTNALNFTANAITVSGSLYGSYASMTQVSANNIYAAGRFSVNDIRRYSGNGNLIFTTTAGTEKMYVDTSQTTEAGVVLQVYGSIRYTGTIADNSTRRIKTNITPYGYDYDAFLDLPVITYNLDLAKVMPDGEGLGNTQIGLIAEDVDEAGFTELVSYDPNDPSLPVALDYTRIGVLLMPIVKELRQEIKDLKTRLDNL
jgi:hypothetical protein